MAPETETIRCLTVCQPWAWAIIAGHKAVENRTRPTSYRGPLMIHAGLSRKWLPEGLRFIREQGIIVPDELLFGAILGQVDLVACVPAGDASIVGNSWAFGPWCWVLANPRAIATPLPYKGNLGVYRVPAAVTSGAVFSAPPAAGVQ